MARDFIILECTEAKAEGKPVSRYISTRNKKEPEHSDPARKEKVQPEFEAPHASSRTK